MAAFGVAAVAQLQAGQPALTADGQLLLCRLALLPEREQGRVGGQQLFAQRAEVGRQGDGGVVRQAQVLRCGGGRAVGHGAAGDERQVAVQGRELLQLAVQGRAVHAGLGAHVQQFEVDFIGFQRAGIARLQTAAVVGGQLLGILQPFVQQLLLAAEVDDVEAGFLCLEQDGLPLGIGLRVQ